MKKKTIALTISTLLAAAAAAGSACAQEVLERFPLDLSSCGGAYVSAHFDHSGKDYHCGTNRYGSHKGTDFAPRGGGPCTVVAAAPGEVVTAVDGNYDANKSADSSVNKCCGSGSGCSYGNYVKIKQEDGTHVVYAHMKKGSLKVKKGDKVTCGQALGTQASSGCSTGTHLHFDISTNSSSGNRFDPYQGSCGTVSKSRWVSQGEYCSGYNSPKLPESKCQCKPSCGGKTCGDDGCGGSCGSCSGNKPICLNSNCVECNSSEKTCADNQIKACVNNAYQYTACKSNEKCVNGACELQPECSASEKPTCADNSVKSCDGMKYVLTPCGSNICHDGKCVACVPENTPNTCDGNRAVACVDGEFAYTDCGGACLNGQCVECLDSDIPVCEGNAVKSCQNNQLKVEACPDDMVCSDGNCVKPSVCDDAMVPVCDGNNIKKCVGGQFELTACAEGQECRDAVCIDKDEPGGDTPGGDEPGGDNPGGDTPGGDTPGGDEPGGDNPGGDNPGGDNPGGDEPGGDEPGGDKPGHSVDDASEANARDATVTLEPSGDCSAFPQMETRHYSSLWLALAGMLGLLGIRRRRRL